VHTVVLFRGRKGSYLVTTRHGTMDVSLEKVSSLRSVPRLYNEDHESSVRSSELVMARDAIRVGCSSGCKVGAGVFRGRGETQLL
jgi:hypothetical protein